MHRLISLAILSSLCGILLTDRISAEDSKAIASRCRQAHAHNDYLHDRPLLDALDSGFGSVEADIFLIDDELLVAHTRREVTPDRTLRGLYLDPLRDRIKRNGGSVHGDGHPFTLLIDIKSNGEPTYRALHKLLSEYQEIFTEVIDDKVTRRAINAVISGNRPVNAVMADSPRYVGIDGRLSDLDSDKPDHLLPMISDHWGRHFKWRGAGEMSAADREKLARVLKQVHDKNRRVRFWATPDNETTWAALRDAGVDLINTDNLSGLSSFLQTNQQPKK